MQDYIVISSCNELKTNFSFLKTYKPRTKNRELVICILNLVFNTND